MKQRKQQWKNKNRKTHKYKYCEEILSKILTTLFYFEEKTKML